MKSICALSLHLLEAPGSSTPSLLFCMWFPLFKLVLSRSAGGSCSEAVLQGFTSQPCTHRVVSLLLFCPSPNPRGRQQLERDGSAASWLARLELTLLLPSLVGGFPIWRRDRSIHLLVVGSAASKAGEQERMIVPSENGVLRKNSALASFCLL